MKKSLFAGIFGLAALCAGATDLFFYSPEDGNGGLRFAVSDDGKNWRSIGNGFDFVRSDFGSWGSGKKMWSPQLFPTSSGWSCLFRVNPEGTAIGWAQSPDLINWKPQEYMLAADTAKLTFRSNVGFVPSVIDLDGKKVSGFSMKTDEKTVKSLEDHAAERGRLAALYSEHCDKDGERFAGLQPLKASVTASGDSKEISPLLMGIFFEDINYAADGGLYAELVQNRDFEYDPEDCNGADPTWGPTHSWTARGVEFGIGTDGPIHPNNPHYATIAVGADGGALCNAGFDGIAVRKGEKYDFSMFARVREGARKVRVSLIAPDGRTLATGSVTAPLSRWGKVKTTLTASETCDSATLALEPAGAARLDADMVSLFPRTTFRGRRNGLRADLADTIAALRPRFVRFPGGCVAHGDGLGNIYRWKNTIGPLEARKPQRNLWGYHQTAGLGYHEYFEFCEDLGAEPLPVVAAGVPCQNSWHGGAGQQGGIPMDEMDEYVQDVLDLIEYANGDARTTRWGRERARNGHAEPFGLNYLGVGNEDFISEVFKERFAMIFKAVRERYPEITVIGTVGPFRSGSDYEEGWAFATAQGVPVVDEHYYESPGWFIYNQDYYDAYDRSQPHVYLGEYASRGNTLYNALAEAAYLCGTERNGDVVEMTSYAPLLAKEGRTSWNPDMIYFTNTEVHPTVNYRVQRLFGENAGTAYVPSQLTLDTADGAVRARVAASVVTTDGGDTIVKLVNILPAEVRLAMELPEGGAAATTLSGDARSTSDYSLAQSTLDGGRQTVTLPPYSMTVIKYRR